MDGRHHDCSKKGRRFNLVSALYHVLDQELILVLGKSTFYEERKGERNGRSDTHPSFADILQSGHAGHEGVG